MNLEILKQDNTSFQKQECLFSYLKIYIVLEILANEIWQEKEIKDIPVGEEDVKLSSSGENMNFFVESPMVCREKNSRINT